MGNLAGYFEKALEVYKRVFRNDLENESLVSLEKKLSLIKMELEAKKLIKNAKNEF